MISVLAARKRISPDICDSKDLCSRSVIFPRESLAQICNGPSVPAGILAFGSFLYNRLSIKPQMTDGKCGGRDELRTQGRETEEGEFPRIEHFRSQQCLCSPWTVCTVKYSRFAGSVLVEWLVPSICRRDSGCREQRTQGCRTDFLREGHPAWIHPSSRGCGVTSDVVKPKLPVWVLYLDYKHSSASNLLFAF